MSNDLADIEKQTGLTRDQAIAAVRAFNRAQHRLNELIPENPFDANIAVAILLGQLEGKPLATSKIALFVGLPRSTAARRIAAMRDANVLVTNPAGDRSAPALTGQFAIKLVRILSKLTAVS
jgi:Fic family protein